MTEGNRQKLRIETEGHIGFLEDLEDDLEREFGENLDTDLDVWYDYSGSGDESARFEDTVSNPMYGTLVIRYLEGASTAAGAYTAKKVIDYVEAKRKEREIDESDVAVTEAGEQEEESED